MGVKGGGGLELPSELPIDIAIGAVCVTGVEGGQKVAQNALGLRRYLKRRAASELSGIENNSGSVLSCRSRQRKSPAQKPRKHHASIHNSQLELIDSVSSMR